MAHTLALVHTLMLAGTHTHTLNLAISFWLPGNAPVLDHDKGILAAKQIRKLVDHCLHNILQIRTQLLEVAHVGEVDGYECGPPANGQVLAVHAV